MRRLLALCLGPLVTGLLGITLEALPAARASPSLRPPALGLLEEVSPCVPEYEKVAGPDLQLLGETVDITLHVKVVCAGEIFPLHIVLVLDGSDSMAGPPRQQMQQAASRMVRSLDLENYPGTQVGVVEFNSAARTLCRLTNDSNRAVNCVNRVQAAGGTAIDKGIQEGSRVLRRGRSGRDPDDITEVMVLFSDGHNDAGCDPVLKAARQAKGQGILLIAICVGSGCDEACMRQVASSPRYYFKAENAGALQGIFEQIRDRLLNIVIRKLEIKDTLPSNMAYVINSANPRQTDPADPVDYLLWEELYIPREGVTYTFRVQPLQVGHWPTNLDTTGKLTDNKSRVREWHFESPWVTVLRPDPLPTLATWTPTLTPTPTDTPTPRPNPVYLAILKAE